MIDATEPEEPMPNRQDWARIFADECARITAERPDYEIAKGLLAKITGKATDYDVPFAEAAEAGRTFLWAHYADDVAAAAERERTAVDLEIAQDAEDEDRPTDLANARRFCLENADRIRYCPDRKRWLAWDGRRWNGDAVGAADRMAKRTVDRMYREASDARGSRRRELIAHAIRSESAAKIRAMLELARTEHGIEVRSKQLDTDPYLLNAENGTIDLKTGALRPHDPADLITRLVPAVYAPENLCPRWDQFLDRIMGGNRAMVRFLQRAVGYSLTADTSEHCLFILWGSGANGKSTFISTVETLMADYAVRCPVESLLVKRGGGASNDIARLDGARFVSAVEAQDGRRLDEALVKQLTGGDTVAARYLYSEYEQFRPSGKIWLGTNFKPRIFGTDLAIWRRVRLIPFAVTIPEAERDLHLAEKLRDEASGILAWATAGVLFWQSRGLDTPDEVRAATAAYREDEDQVGRFVAACCRLVPDAVSRHKDLYGAFRRWAEENGEHAMSGRRFASDLRDRGLDAGRDAANDVTRRGIALVE